MSQDERTRALIQGPGADGTVATWRAGVLQPEATAGGIPTAITVANEATDTSCFPLFVTAATGDLGPKTNAGLAFNSNTGLLNPTAVIHEAFAVTNSSGATAAANDVGYIDVDGSYKTTTTSGLDALWCVVLIGGANAATIYVARRGVVTVELDGNCSAGNLLKTSATAGQATPFTAAAHYGTLGVCLTANASGAGGTCSALLLTGTRYVPATSANLLVQINSHSNFRFEALINSGGTGGLTATNVPYDNVGVGSGASNIKPVSSSELGKIRLFNSTRSTYRLVTAVNVATFAITTVSSTDAWADNDVITAQSQTNTDTTWERWWDIDLSQSTATIPVTARSLDLSAGKSDTGAGNQWNAVHPWETFGSGRVRPLRNQVATFNTDISFLVKLTEGRFTWACSASGAGTATSFLRLCGYFEACP